MPPRTYEEDPLGRARPDGSCQACAYETPGWDTRQLHRPGSLWQCVDNGGCQEGKPLTPPGEHQHRHQPSRGGVPHAPRHYSHQPPGEPRTKDAKDGIYHLRSQIEDANVETLYPKRSRQEVHPPHNQVIRPQALDQELSRKHYTSQNVFFTVSFLDR